MHACEWDQAGMEFDMPGSWHKGLGAPCRALLDFHLLADQMCLCVPDVLGFANAALTLYWQRWLVAQ